MVKITKRQKLVITGGRDASIMMAKVYLSIIAHLYATLFNELHLLAYLQ